MTLEEQQALFSVQVMLTAIIAKMGITGTEICMTADALQDAALANKVRP